MTTSNPVSTVTRRTALAGLSAGGLSLALATTGSHVSAQDAPPSWMVGHPMVGTWIVDRDVTTETDSPSIVVYSADGGLLDPSQGVAGAWRPTGPRSAEWTLVVFLDGGAGGYLAVRSIGEVDEGGNSLESPYSFTVVSTNGTVMASGEGLSHYSRLQIELMADGGKPLAGFPTWTPTAPEATPTS
jgi:hypothetical protein